MSFTPWVLRTNLNQMNGKTINTHETAKLCIWATNYSPGVYEVNSESYDMKTAELLPTPQI